MRLVELLMWHTDLLVLPVIVILASEKALYHLCVLLFLAELLWQPSPFLGLI